MKNFKITITGSGTKHQIEIRLLEVGRMLQLVEDNELSEMAIKDGVMITKITEE